MMTYQVVLIAQNKVKQRKIYHGDTEIYYNKIQLAHIHFTTTCNGKQVSAIVTERMMTKLPKMPEKF